MTTISTNDGSNGVAIDKIPTPRQVETTYTNKKTLFVDLPQIMGLDNETKRPDFVQLAKNLWREFDDIRAYGCFKKWDQIVPGTKIFPKIYQCLSYTGIYPTLTPSDPDPIIAAEIIKIAHREGDRLLIGLLSGDAGYYPALAEAKKAGSTIKIILPNGNCPTTLKSIADEISNIKDYAPEYTAQQPILYQQCNQAKEEKSLIQKATFSMKKSNHIRMEGA